ncbi:MAG: TetR/AcrR family transcriptional regulator C-terminal domain-containing protein, partial [Candidatus Limnocylindria bacterium]
AREAFRRHPWASLLWIRLGIGPARIRYMDAALRAFREAGFSVELTEKAYHAVEDHIAGYTLQAQNFPLDAADLVEVGEAFYRALPRDQYPYLAEHVRQHLDVSGLDSEGEYAFGLGLILDGIERLWKEERRESSAERLSPGAPRGGGPSHPRP